MPITIKLARFLVSCGYIDYTEWELRREDREYVCNLDGKILTFHSLSHHYRTHHPNIYNTLIHIISQRIVMPPDILILVLKQNITLLYILFLNLFIVVDFPDPLLPTKQEYRLKFGGISIIQSSLSISTKLPEISDIRE